MKTMLSQFIKFVSAYKKLFLLAAFLTQIGCSSQNEPPLGGKSSYPFSMVSYKNSVYQLNAAADGQYKDGNIIHYELNSSGNALTQTNYVSTPRLGSSLAIDTDGKYLAASFGSEKSEVRIYDIQKSLTEVNSWRFTLPEGGVPSYLQIVNGKEFGKPENFYLIFSTRAKTSQAKVYLVELSSNKATSKLEFPSSLQKYSLDEISFGYSSPMLSSEKNILLMFPQGLSQDYSFEQQYLKDFLKGTENNLSDFRPYSLVALDLKQYLQGGNLQASTGFYPIIFNDSGTSPEFGEVDQNTGQKKYDENLEVNKSQNFKTGFGFAQSRFNNSCFNENIQNLNSVEAGVVDKIILANNDTQEVYQMSFENSFTTLINAEQNILKTGESHKRKILGIPSVKPYSSKQNVPELKDESFALSELKFMFSGSKCVPTWLRWEQDNNVFGNEKVRIQLNEDISASAPVSFVLPISGRASLTTVGDRVIYANHARSSIGILKFVNNNFEVLK
jgi:hypothetical protein